MKVLKTTSKEAK